MPKRTDAHKVEADSVNAFRQLVESAGHIFRELKPDYGIDGEVEEFGDDGEPTGNRFFVQLKGTAKPGADAMRTRLRLDTRDYYRAQPVPVLMIRYIGESGELYARWFHEFDGYYEHVGETHLTFHWYPENELSAATFPKLFAHAGRVLRFRAEGADLPVTLAVVVPAAGTHGLARSELEVELAAAIGRCPGVLEEAVDADSADLVAEISDEEIRADLSGLASVTFHLGEGVYATGTSADSIAGDILCCAAGALVRARQGAPAARIAVEFLPDSLLAAIPEVTAEFAWEITRAGRVREALDVAERLDADGEQALETSGGFFSHFVMGMRHTLQPEDRAALEDHLRARLARRIERDQPRPAAAAAENVGRILMDQARRAEAVEFFDRALELYPDSETPQFAELLAGAIFLSNDFGRAVSAYERAIELASAEDVPGLQARRADALLYAGRYREALEAFSEVETDDRELQAWVYVKYRAIDWVISVTGIEAQERDPVAAHALASGKDPVELVLAEERIWELDAVNHLAWVQNGRALAADGEHGPAMQGFLVAAVMSEGDFLAWIHTTVLAAIEDDPLFVAAAVTGARLNKPDFMPELSRMLRETTKDLEKREEILSMVKGAIALGEGVEPSS